MTRDSNLLNKVQDSLRWLLLLNKPVYYKRFYSIDGEDAILDSLYEGKPKYKGFYLDIGAYHPLRYSNTHYFYEKGWNGINIDATPGSM
jgi:hypothetical protein